MTHCFICNIHVRSGEHSVETIEGVGVKLCTGCWTLYMLWHAQEAAKE